MRGGLPGNYGLPQAPGDAQASGSAAAPPVRRETCFIARKRVFADYIFLATQWFGTSKQELEHSKRELESLRIRPCVINRRRLHIGHVSPANQLLNGLEMRALYTGPEGAILKCWLFTLGP